MFDTDTANLGLPLLQPSQAQKHVAVNEALMRLDGLVNLVLKSVERTLPPETVTDGACFAVPAGAAGAWAGAAGKVAVGSNNGWVFVAPQLGQRAFVADRGMQAVFNGTEWILGALTLGSFGSAMLAQTAESEVTLGSGSSHETDLIIPARALVIGVTAKVSNALTGTLTSWRLGTTGALNRFGSGMGVARGSWAGGLLSAPLAYWDATPLIVTATGGSFTGGKIRMAAHWLSLRVPD